MQILFSLLLAFAFNIILLSPASAQQFTDRKFDRLMYRYQINDIDGIGELIEPLWQRYIQAAAEFDLPQQQLIALAATKFYVHRGEHYRAILPYLTGLQIQNALKKESLELLIELPDNSFRLKHLPPIFYSEKAQRQFRCKLDAAIDHGVLRESELVAKYRDSAPDQLSKIQTEMLTSISAAKANASPSDRDVLRLIDSFVTQKDKHTTLAHESLATAIEALQRLNRIDEADRLAEVFRTQFPDSRRLKR